MDAGILKKQDTAFRTVMRSCSALPRQKSSISASSELSPRALSTRPTICGAKWP